MEVWKGIKDYEGLYEVSNLGRVRSVERKVYTIRNGQEYNRILKSKILTPITHTANYHYVVLCKEGVRKNFLVHRLVAQMFIDNPFDKEQVNHIDGVKTNNNVTNLEWSTPLENMQHASELGLRRLGEEHHNVKLTDEQIEFIRINYKPRHKEFGSHALAKRFNVSQGHISGIVNYRKRK